MCNSDAFLGHWIVEAMKLMNEIESEVDGVIAEVLVKNGEMVDYGKPLFRVKA